MTLVLKPTRPGKYTVKPYGGTDSGWVLLDGIAEAEIDQLSIMETEAVRRRKEMKVLPAKKAIRRMVRQSDIENISHQFPKPTRARAQFFATAVQAPFHPAAFKGV